MVNESILTIIGPTASGKTKLSIEIAKLLNGEVIGLDSRQIYKDMSIGTAQPTIDEMEGIPHHLYGFHDPGESISAGKIVKLIKDKITMIKNSGNTPIISGGAGLYYRALKNGIFKGSLSNESTRLQLEDKYDKDPEALFHQLKLIDPDYAKIVHINNKKRMVRALEIYELTNKSPTEHFLTQKKELSDTMNLFTIFLSWEKDKLIDRISKRTDEMLSMGWIDEVQNLIDKKNKLNKSLHPLDSIGYQQIEAYLDNKLTYKEMRDEIIIRTRQFARRQIQWFNKENIDLKIEMGKIKYNSLSKIICDLIIR